MSIVTEAELRAAEAAARGVSADPDALVSLLGVSRASVERLLGSNSQAIGWLVLSGLLWRLEGARVSANRLSLAIRAFQHVARQEIAQEAPDLSLDEVHTAGALLRRELPDVTHLARLLGESTFVAGELLSQFGIGLTDSVTVCLALRLHGMRVDPRAINETILAVLEQRAQQLRREAAH